MSQAEPFSIAAFLQELPYFADLPAAKVEPLAARAVPRHFPPDAILFLQGEPSAGLWIVERGRVKILRMTPEGKEHILHLRGPGQTFNDIPALDGRPNAATATAVNEVDAWVLPTAVLQTELQQDHELALAVIRGLTKRIRGLAAQIEDLALRSVTARLARFLLEQPLDPALRGPAVTRALIATHLATTPETVSRALRTLEETGAITFDRQQIILRRPDLLREIAML